MGDTVTAPEATRLVRSVRHRLAALLVARVFSRLLTVWCTAGGLLVLACRMRSVSPWWLLPWGTAGMLVCLAGATVFGVRRTPPPAAVAALLDRLGRCGGLLMARDDGVALDAWAATLVLPPRPQVRWAWRGPMCSLLTAVLFLALAGLLPQRVVRPVEAPGLDVGGIVADLHARIAVLEEEDVLETETADELRQKLDALGGESSAWDPADTWAALDHLAEGLADRAGEAAQEAVAEIEALAEAAEQARALADASAELGEGSVLTEAMAALADRLADEALLRAAAAGDADAQGVDSLLQDGALSAAELGELAKALNGQQAGLSCMVGRLCDAGLIGGGWLLQCQNAQEMDGEALAAFLAECGLAAAELMGGLPGRGGVTRGRGDAPMTWSSGTSEEGVDFKEETLPPATLAALRDSELVGVSLGAPRQDENAPGAVHGALGQAKAGGGAGVAHRLLPRHRRAVTRFFTRNEGGR